MKINHLREWNDRLSIQAVAARSEAIYTAR